MTKITPAGLELAKSGHAVLQLILQGVQGQPAHKHCCLDIVMMSGLCGCSIGPAVLNPYLHFNTAVNPMLILVIQSCSGGTSSPNQVWTDEEEAEA